MGLIELLLISVGLAMDAFAVSVGKGMTLKSVRPRHALTAGVWFGVFQGLMPLIGWVCVHTVAQYFAWFEKLIPWIALGLLGFIGGKMLYEGITCKCDEEEEDCCKHIGFAALIVQGIATSIDALSVGFTIADYGLIEALLCAALIAAVTFFICLGGILIGRKVGTCLAGKAGILGGAILIFIGLEIFITSWF
jgi:putative Mn2+ efflux pump MntP